MTHFEFISVAVSIVLALSAARLLTALPHVLAPGRRYWVHALWSVTLLSMHLGFWWAIWIYREIDPWTFRSFAAVMLTPGLMYLTVSTLVSDSPTSIESWRTHFHTRHRTFFSLYLATVLSIPQKFFRAQILMAKPYNSKVFVDNYLAVIFAAAYAKVVSIKAYSIEALI